MIPLPPEPEEPALAGMTEEPSGERPAGATATGQEHEGTDELVSPRERVVPIRTYSAAERLRQKDFGHLTPAELEEARPCSSSCAGRSRGGARVAPILPSEWALAGGFTGGRPSAPASVRPGN
ncbi:MAG: hypothetical protein KatS3mg061_2567 [Dehalococcoidia bacterium]|nr:MAG: hypothetical protein KatS3mg061_2567 [Dehalococcoidia bacterium]